MVNRKDYFKEQGRREITSKRSQCTKVYENEDHTMTAAIYGRPVHFLEDGQWKEYDDSLTESGTEGDMENGAGDLKVKFSNKIKEEKTIRISNEQGDLSWGPEKGRKAVRNLTGTSSVTYEDVWEDVNLRYTLAGGSLKEDIILKSLPEAGAFRFLYRSNSLHAQSDNRGNVVFVDDKGEPVFTISAPYMRDAAGTVSTAVNIRLDENDINGGHTSVIVVEADMVWLSAPERMWPVTIDPMVRTSSSIYDIHDVHVSSWYNTDNFENSHILKTGYIDGSTLRSYLKFTLPEISPADMVLAAYFQILNYSTSSVERRIDIHKVTESWNHNTINWNNKPSYDTRVIDYCTFTNNVQDGRLFNITDLVKDWYQNGKNYGLLMKDSSETGCYTEYLSADCHQDFANERPCILIQYVNNTGIEDYWTYHSHSVGRAGTGYVNDYNGNQIFIHPTLSMTGNRMPVNLTHVFNSNDRGTDIGYGLGFRLNYHQTIESLTLSNTQYYKQVDGDGTAHYFAFDSKENKWKDEGNKDRVLTIGTDSSSKYTIKDKEDNQLIFNSAGLLVKIQDANGNTLAVTYSSNKITKLTDGSGRVVTLAYGTDGRLSSVTDPAGRVKRFGYTGGRLTSITDVDEAVCRFTYDTASGKGMMLSAADPYGYKITYSYYSQKPYRMKKISETAGSTAGKSITLTYGYNRTTFTDNKGRSESYMFDHAGRTVSVRNDEGYGAAWQYLDSGNNANKLSAASALQYVPVQLLKGITGGLTGWNKYASESTITVAADSAQGYVGSQSVCISSTALTGRGAVIQEVSLISGRSYVFSAYAKEGISEAASNGCI